MSRRRKEVKPLTQTSNEVQVDLTSYRVFFQESLSKGLVKSWQEQEIHAFFKDLGLTDKEPSDKYKIALTKY